MYVRVKRQKQTVFLYTDPSENIADLKKKLAEILSVPANRLRLIYNDVVLDDGKTVGDHKIENEKVVFVVFKKDGASGRFRSLPSLSSLTVTLGRL